MIGSARNDPSPRDFPVYSSASSLEPSGNPLENSAMPRDCQSRGTRASRPSGPAWGPTPGSDHRCTASVLSDCSGSLIDTRPRSSSLSSRSLQLLPTKRVAALGNWKQPLVSERSPDRAPHSLYNIMPAGESSKRETVRGCAPGLTIAWGTISTTLHIHQWHV